MAIRSSARSLELQDRLTRSMDEFVSQVEAVRHAQLLAAGDPHSHPQVVEDLTAEAKRQGLWNLFLPGSDLGAGLTDVHHAPLAEIMRVVGMTERALDLLVDRAVSRTTFGEPLAHRADIQDWIAEARVDLEMIRLLTMKAAYLMDTVANRQARVEMAAVKVAAPTIAARIIDRAIQVPGGAGLSDDFPLAEMYV